MLAALCRLGRRHQVVTSCSRHLSTPRGEPRANPAAGVICSPYPDLDLPVSPMHEVIFRNSARYGSAPALINGESGRVFTYDQTKDAIWRTSSALSRQGMKKGDVMMIISSNVPEFQIMFFAVTALGGVVSFVSPLYQFEEMLRQVQDSHATFLCVEEEAAYKAKQIAVTTGQIKKTYVIGRSEGLHPFSDLMEDSGSESVMDAVDIDPKKDLCLLPYSSGTTGKPKGILHTHFAACGATLHFEQPDFWVEREGAVQLGVVPFSNLTGHILVGCSALSMGQTLVTMRRFEPEPFIENLQRYKVSVLVIVSALVGVLTKHPLAAKCDLSSLRRCAVGGGPVGPGALAEFNSKFPHVQIGQGYGLSETMLLCVNPLKDCRRKPGTLGKLVADVRMKVINQETGEVLGVNQTGELCVRGPHFMKGYHNNPQADAETVDSDGWLHTGDVGYYDEEGSVFMVGRSKELIKYKGNQVAPAELEDLILRHPAVQEVVVTGYPDPMAGELPRAHVVLKPGKTPAALEIQQFVADRVAPHKKLRGGVVFIDHIPKLAVGKINRKAVDELNRREAEGRTS